MEENNIYFKMVEDELKNLLMFKIGFNLLVETLELNYNNELTIDGYNVVKILKSIIPLSVKRKKEELLKKKNLKNKEFEKSEE